jgi:hypothetical protein
VKSGLVWLGLPFHIIDVSATTPNGILVVIAPGSNDQEEKAREIEIARVDFETLIAQLSKEAPSGMGG